MFHDIAKPRTKKGEGANATFYAHEIVGAKMTRKVLRRLKFSNKDVEKWARELIGRNSKFEQEI